MAALSCYQPCRSHLAQPARCLDDEEYSSATLSLRRRQERCEPRRREPLPEVSVQRTREQLAKHAAQTLPARRLNHDGWAKVEEVRKKFEGAATATSYSRSFESPPRRRLADSLFASFKLPRKKEMSAPRAPQPQQKRKSAVELLAETKAFYVKSETVLDRKQELPLRVSSGLSQAIAAGGCHLVSSGALNDACCNPYATTRITGSRRAVSAGEGLQNTLRRLLEHSDSRENVYPPPYVYATTRITGSRRAVSAGEGLQNTLRRLLEHADSRENVYPPPYVSQKLFSESRRLKDSYPERERSQHTSGAYSGTSSSGTSGGPRDERNRHSFGDARVFFPESFVIPRQRPEVVVKSAYSIPSPESSPRDGLPELSRSGDQLDTISPPAEYAHSAPRYMRSNSHSAPSAREGDATNINSHKSLPDLHAQAHGYPEHANPVVGSESTGRSPRRRRHSAHHRTASCSSKGTRSNHSSLMSSCDAFSEHPSPGEENYQSYNSRCGSSFARDSGGSSGHYTQRSAPPHAHDVRPSRYAWPASGGGGGGAEPVYVSAPPQFQDGAPSPPQYAHAHAAPHPPHTPSRVGIHFQASAPPPQFQDEPPVYEYGDYDCTYKAPLKCLNVGRKDYTKTREYSRYHEPNTEVVNKQPQYQEVRMRPNIDEKKDYVNAPQVCQTEEVTSPLGTFKRQRCLRYKQRRPRPILRSKSDISDRYRRSDTGSAPGEASPGSGSSGGSALQHFFDHLGLEGRTFDALFRDPPASPVFFSSASTVDSNQLAATADYTVQGPGVQKQIYRNTEPPSVVERNARIIKWLCQCRKAQMQTPQ